MTQQTYTRRIATAAFAVTAIAGLGASTGLASASAAPESKAPSTWNIPDVSPKGKQLVGNVELFADFGNYPIVPASGEHWCQEPNRTGMESIAGRMWSFAEDYTTDGESFYKNDADVVVSGWTDGQKAFNRFTVDKLKCNWLNPQQRLAWTGKNPDRYWLSTSGKVGTKYAVTGAVRVGDMIVSVTGRSTKAATAREMATRMTLAVERNLRATDLVRR